MTKNEQLKRLIEGIVRKEVKRLMPEMVKSVLAEVVGGMIMEAAVPKADTSNGNSHKRISLTEAAFASDKDEEYKSYPNLDRKFIAERLGYGDFVGNTNGYEMFVKEVITENGTKVPVRDEDIPDYMRTALSRNYSDIMEALNKRKNG